MRSWDAYLALTERALDEAFASLGDVPPLLTGAMRYSLEAGGKRLRPVLLLASCELAGGRAEEALPWAAGLEMIHTYSLVHDDLPAMDDDDLRRGRPSSHRVYGEGMAILAGDGLLSAAFETMLRAACRMESLRGTRAAEAIARRAGTGGMVGGQVCDVTLEGQPVTEERVRYIHLHKTADLITAGVEAGLLLAGASEGQLRAGIAYGQHLGVAFQIADDILDVTGDAAVLGKQTGLDAAAGKQTWVALRGLEEARRDAEAEAAKAAEAIGAFGPDAALFTELARTAVSRVK